MSTQNGAQLLSRLSGLSEAEIRWTFDRMKSLLASGMSNHEAKAIVKAECKSRPWEAI